MPSIARIDAVDALHQTVLTGIERKAIFKMILIARISWIALACLYLKAKAVVMALHALLNLIRTE